VPVNWNKEIDAAQSPREVVGVVNDYLENLAPELVQRIPAMWRPSAIGQPFEVHQWHFRLIEDNDILNGMPGDLRLQDLVVFFMSASRRLRELEGGNRGQGRNTFLGTVPAP
jgi:hypothetical protein